MNRYGKTEKLWENICSPYNVERSMRDILVKHKYKGMKVADYSAEQKYVIAHWQECKNFVVEQLKNETYVLSELRHKTIFDRKQRELHFPITFPDKIYYRCVYNVLKPYFYKKFTYNTYNCIEGRGLIKAKEAVEAMMRKFPDGYYVQTDCRKYYDSIVHRILKKVLWRTFKCKKVLGFFNRMLEVYNSGSDTVCGLIDEYVGLAIGINLTQLLAILYRSVIAHEVERLFACPLVEVTDDLLAGFPTKKEANDFLKWYIEKNRQRGLTIKSSARVAPMSEPIHAFGFIFLLDKNGNPYTLLRKNIKEGMKRKHNLLVERGVSDEVYKQQMASYYGWCKHAQCRHLMRCVMKDRYRLFENIEMERLERLKDKRKSMPVEFGLTKNDWVSILTVEGKDIVLLDGHYSTVYFEEVFNKNTGEKEKKSKYVFKFHFVGDESEHFSITTSQSLADRIEDVLSLAPFVCNIKKQCSRYGKFYYVLD